MVSKLDWDSKLFNYPVGFVKVSNKIFDLERFINESKKYKLIYIYSDIELNFNLNLKLVDKKVVFNKFAELRKTNLDIKEFNSEIHSYKELLELTYLSGISSRFKTDTNFSNDEFVKLYKKWINSSIFGDIAIKILIKYIERKIVGFITLGIKNSNTTQIGLIAVNKRFQGQNIASELIYECEKESVKRGYANIEVATQYNNQPAIKLYKKNNFKLISSTYIYHFWNHDTI